MERETLHSISHAAERLCLKPATVYALIDRGVIRAVRIGSRSLRIRASDLERIMTEGTATTAIRAV